VIGPDNFPKVLRIELSRQDSGIDQITKHHRELAPFGVCHRRDRWRFRMGRWVFVGGRQSARGGQGDMGLGDHWHGEHGDAGG